METSHVANGWAIIIPTISEGSLAAEDACVVGALRGVLANRILRILAELRHQVRLMSSSIPVPVIMIKWTDEKHGTQLPDTWGGCWGLHRQHRALS